MTKKVTWILVSLFVVQALASIALPFIPKVEAATKTIEVTATSLNVRSGPSTGYGKIGTVTKGDRYRVASEKSGWYQINYGTKKGWVHGSYVKVIGENGVKINTKVLNVRSSYSTSSQILTRVTQGQTYLIQESKNGWYKINANGKNGWIHGGYVLLVSISQPQPEPVPTPEPAPSKEKIRLAWDYEASLTNVDKPSSQTGYNVVSPAWYYVTGDASNPSGIDINTSMANQAYVDKAHKNGYKVWALFSDIHDKYQPTRTAAIFNNPTKEDVMIQKLVNDVVAKNIDGVNIDFEGMGKSNRDHFTKFVQKLSTALKAKDKMVSVDVTGYAANSPWSECYDRVALGKIVDYMAFMAYDEHWATSPTAGSVASLGWVENHLKKMVTEVPKEKILLGVPFYTRDWKLVLEQIVETQATSLNIRQEATTASGVVGKASQGGSYTYLGTVEGQNINGKTDWYKIQYEGNVGYVSDYYTIVKNLSSNNNASSSSAIGIGTQNSIISKYNAKVMYDTASGQNVATYRGEDGTLHKIWMEDKLSIGKRVDLAVKYDLGGMGAWRLGFETQEIWPIIANKIK